MGVIMNLTLRVWKLTCDESKGMSLNHFLCTIPTSEHLGMWGSGAPGSHNVYGWAKTLDILRFSCRDRKAFGNFSKMENSQN